MNPLSRPLARLLFAFVVVLSIAPRTSFAYSVLSHEEVVDMAWKTTLVPMLKQRFPGITEDQIIEAHAYAYGGSVIQDIGYYPFGSHYFSNLLHYVRPDVFVENLIRDSKTPDEYAFALGALAHFCGDTVGHPYINEVTARENPSLRDRFGNIVTYDEDPTAHVRTEFGFDVVEVAHGQYSQQNYHDFIGFQVSKKLLEQAFLETYGLKVNDVIPHEDLAISTYRHSVSAIIPQMTKIAFATYKDQIEQAAPGTAKRTFVYRLNRTEYARDFGTDYTHVGFWGKFFSFILKVVPKAGPFKALKVSIPTPKDQDLFLQSMNKSVDQYKTYLGGVHSAPAPLPPPDAKDADTAQQAAQKLDEDVSKSQKLAAKAKDPKQKAEREQAAKNVEKAAHLADESANRSVSAVAVEQATGAPPPPPAGALPYATKIKPPVAPDLPELDLDTGKPARAGEYLLADETYAQLLNDLVKPKSAAKLTAAVEQQHQQVAKAQDQPSGQPTAPKAVTPARLIEAKLAASIEQFFADPEKPNQRATPKERKIEAAMKVQVTANLAKLRTMTAPAALTAEFGSAPRTAKGY